MKFLKTILLLLILITTANANTIYNLIKIPNLEIYENKSSNGLKYLMATKPFQVGIRDNNVTCFNSNIEDIDEKFEIIQRNLNKYSSNFLEKINLKYIVLCEKLSVSGINSAGVPNHEMKTLIIDIKFDNNYFERVIHHEVFHIIHESFKSYFQENDWKKYNNTQFKYAECSTCSDRLDLSTIKETNGFLTEYSMSTASEDMAEIFSFLMTKKNSIKIKNLKDNILINKISFIKKKILKIDDKFKFNL